MAVGEVWDQPLILYPPTDSVNHDAPQPIRTAFEEAGAAFRERAYTAAAIMCRKTLEGICASHGVTQRTLMQSLDQLRADGVIEARLYEWANALRIAGNEAAHDVRVTVSRDDARDMLDFTKAILDYTFSFRDKFEKFKARRANSS